jgi:hypothetical protein
MEGYINVYEFITHLTEQGLVIVKKSMINSKKDYEYQALKLKQRELLAKGWLTYNEILKSELLSYKSRSGLIAALQKRSKHKNEVKVVRGVTRVLTSVIKEMQNA